MALSSLPPLPRTLILDFYDSYTNNLVTLFTKLYSDTEVLEKVVIVKADQYDWTTFKDEILPNLDCVILSPGPGRPDVPSDIGFALDLLRLHPLPILGVCLGHQAIAVAFGGKIDNTPDITHGHVIPVTPIQSAQGLFTSSLWKDSAGTGAFDAVVYNSLTVDPNSLPEELEVTAWSEASNPPTIQGLRHREYSIWGVQYHPESISSTQGSSLLASFLHAVHDHHHRPLSFPALSRSLQQACNYRIASSSSSRESHKPETSHPITPTLPTPPMSPSLSIIEAESPRHATMRLVEKRFGSKGKESRTQDVFEALIRSRKGKEKAVGEVWLDGETPLRPTRTSLAAPSFVLTYTLSTRTITLHPPSGEPQTRTLKDDETFWDWFSRAQITLSVPPDRNRSGWQGGWVGWFGYEMKEESLAGYRRRPWLDGSGNTGEADAVWAWCDTLLERTTEGEWIARAVVNDHEQSEPDELVAWLRELGLQAGVSPCEWTTWVADIGDIFTNLAVSKVIPASSFPTFRPVSQSSQYQASIQDCREAIRLGESYELTLTTSFNAISQADPYSLYLRLRSFNPAYYSTYLSFSSIPTPRGTGVHVLSSSPERFLKIENQENGSRRVEMMPIKGTKARVKPGQCVCAAGRGCGGQDAGSVRCLKEAVLEDKRRGQELQDDLKERAENLMIVDLIRSDLLSCCTPSSVTVPKLIALESYGVHNLVTTVQGSLAYNVGAVECVKRCFPPGSMTGAPKLRSVQLLEKFEADQLRGVYSGTLGYIGVDGAADLSVVIRTIIVQGNQLSLGAGGAITWLSQSTSEWEEVLTKVRSVVGNLSSD
ncbi:ADC synthase [Naematelia encephala]|uniref:aminodeoxychorismate synthase n=1 Tax=Naematelia encephala TaxID=71784 RepID=A0A1Y2AWM7_9TREE|nr:ADC synthase [Naematelia encephala]